MHAGGEETPVSVVVRLRPEPTKSSDAQVIVQRDAHTLELLEQPATSRDAGGASLSSTWPKGKGKNKAKNRVFHFDHVFGGNATQAQVYGVLHPLVQSAIKGYNATAFAYGSTGSGKTFTMMGTPRNPGIVMRAVETLFDTIAQLTNAAPNTASAPAPAPATAAAGGSDSEAMFHVQLMFVELYNNNFRNLLANADTGTGTGTGAGHSHGYGRGAHARSSWGTGAATLAPSKIEVHESEREGVHLTGPRNLRVPVTTAAEVLALLKLGTRNRAVGATNLNEHSSRSHSILTIQIESRMRVPVPSFNRTDVGGDRGDAGEGAGGGEGDGAVQPAARVRSVVRMGKLHLIDLAGSERVALSGAEGDTLVEAQNINLSLTALGDVLSALSHNAELKAKLLAQQQQQQQQQRRKRDRQRLDAATPSSLASATGSVSPAPASPAAITSLSAAFKAQKQLVAYRNSKLTFFLKDSLGGNSKTVMITCLRSQALFYQQSLVTLLYASRAKNVTNVSTVNMDTAGGSNIGQVEREVEMLRSRLVSRTEEFERLQAERNSGAKENEQLRARVERLAAVNAREKMELEAYMTKVVHNQAGMLARQQREATALQKQLDGYERDKVQTTEAQAQAREEAQQAQAKVKEQAARISELEQLCDQLAEGALRGKGCAGASWREVVRRSGGWSRGMLVQAVCESPDWRAALCRSCIANDDVQRLVARALVQQVTGADGTTTCSDDRNGVESGTDAATASPLAHRASQLQERLDRMEEEHRAALAAALEEQEDAHAKDMELTHRVLQQVEGRERAQEERAAALQRELESLREARESSEKAASAAQAELTQCRAAAEERHQLSQDHDSELAAVREDMQRAAQMELEQALREQRAGEEERADSMRREHEAAVQQLEQQLVHRSEALESLRHELAQVKEAHGEQQQQLLSELAQAGRGHKAVTQRLQEEHEAAQEEHEAAMEALRSEMHQAESDGSSRLATATSEIERLRGDVAAAQQQQDECERQHATSVASLEAAHAEKLEQQKQEHQVHLDRELERERERAAHKLEQLHLARTSAAEDAARDEEQQRQELVSHYEAAVQALQNELDETNAQLSKQRAERCDFALQLQTVQKQLTSAQEMEASVAAQLKEQREKNTRDCQQAQNELAAERDAHAAALEQHTSAVSELQAAHAAALKEQQEQYARDREQAESRLATEHDAHAAALKQHANAMSELEAAHAVALEEQKDQLAREREQVEIQLATERDAHAAALKQHTKSTSDLEATYVAQLKEQQEQHNRNREQAEGQHEKERAEMEQQHATALEAVKAALKDAQAEGAGHAETCKDLTSQLRIKEDELEQARVEAATRLDAVHEDFGREREKAAQELAALTEAHTSARDKCSALTQKLDAATALSDERAAQIQNVEESCERRVRHAHQQVEEIRESARVAADEFSREAACKVAVLRREHRMELERRHLEDEARISVIEADAAKKLETQHQQHQQAISELEAAHTATLEQQREQHAHHVEQAEGELAAVRDAHAVALKQEASALDEQKQQHAAALVALEQELESAQGNTRRQHAKHEAMLDAERGRHAAAIAEIEKSHAAQLEELQHEQQRQQECEREQATRDLASQSAQMKKDHAQECADLRQRHAAATAELKALHEKQLQEQEHRFNDERDRAAKIHTDATSEHTAAMQRESCARAELASQHESVRQMLQAEIVDLRTQLDEQCAKGNDVVAQMRVLEKDLASAQELEAARAAQLKEQQEQHNRNREQAEGQHEKERAEMEQQHATALEAVKAALKDAQAEGAGHAETCKDLTSQLRIKEDELEQTRTATAARLNALTQEHATAINALQATHAAHEDDMQKQRQQCEQRYEEEQRELSVSLRAAHDASAKLMNRNAELSAEHAAALVLRDITMRLEVDCMQAQHSARLASHERRATARMAQVVETHEASVCALREQQKEALRHHAKELRCAEERHAAQLRQQCEQHDEQAECERQQHEQALAAMRERAAQREAELTSEHGARLEAAVASAQAVHAEAEARTVDACRSEMTTMHETMLEVQRAKHANELAAAEQRNAVNVHRIKEIEQDAASAHDRLQATEDELARTVQAAQDEAKASRLAAEEQLEAQQQRHLAVIAEMESAHAMQLGDQEREQQQQIEREREQGANDLAAHTSQIAEQQAKERADQQQQHAVEIDAVRSELGKAREQLSEQKLRVQAAQLDAHSLQAELHEARQQLEARAVTISCNAEKIQNMEQELEQARTGADEALSTQRQRLAATRAELEAAAATQLKDQQEEHARDRAQIESELAAAREAHAAALKQHEALLEEQQEQHALDCAQADRKLEAVRSAHAMALEQQREQNARDLEQAKSELAAQRDAHAAAMKQEAIALDELKQQHAKVVSDLEAQHAQQMAQQAKEHVQASAQSQQDLLEQQRQHNETLTELAAVRREQAEHAQKQQLEQQLGAHVAAQCQKQLEHERMLRLDDQCRRQAELDVVVRGALSDKQSALAKQREQIKAEVEAGGSPYLYDRSSVSHSLSHSRLDGVRSVVDQLSFGDDTTSSPRRRPHEVSNLRNHFVSLALDGEADEIKVQLQAAGISDLRQLSGGGMSVDANRSSVAAVDGTGAFLPLHKAVSGLHFHGERRRVVRTLRVLLEHHAAIDATDDKGNTALHKAIQVCSSNAVIKVLQVLLRHGANTNVQNDEGESALVLELKRERHVSPKVVSLLLQYGASADRAALPRRLSSVLDRLLGQTAAAREQGPQGPLQESQVEWQGLGRGAPPQRVAAATAAAAAAAALPPPPPSAPPRRKILQAQGPPHDSTPSAPAVARTPLAPTSAGALNTSAGQASSAWEHGAVEIV